MAKKNWPFGTEDEPDKEQRDEIDTPDGGVGEIEPSDTPDRGIRHRGNPPAPAMDAPTPPQNLPPDEQKAWDEEKRRQREQEQHEQDEKRKQDEEREKGKF